ncbi:MAG: hypothetical protein PHI35_02880 [Victivallaceae bacterium]|nr:hypothetical protein [Victivallaceae bacterium]
MTQRSLQSLERAVFSGAQHRNTKLFAFLLTSLCFLLFTAAIGLNRFGDDRQAGMSQLSCDSHSMQSVNDFGSDQSAMCANQTPLLLQITGATRSQRLAGINHRLNNDAIPAVSQNSDALCLCRTARAVHLSQHLLLQTFLKSSLAVRAGPSIC